MVFAFALAPGMARAGERQTINLDGTWQIAEGLLDVVPEEFKHTVPVPGLVDLAEPPFEAVAARPRVKVIDDPLREAFWYRRTFEIDGEIPEVALLRIRKAPWGSKVILNGVDLGEHFSSFTWVFLDAAKALREGENELIIRVGADHAALPREALQGFDGERRFLTPGIWDSVDLIRTGTPYIRNVQVAPVIDENKALVRIWLEEGGGPVTAELKDSSGEVVGKTEFKAANKDAQTLDGEVAIPDAKLWSPENPHLYTLVVRTKADDFTTRFGMREFRLDPETGWAMLNGEKYAMRGTNVALQRFFDDPLHSELAWDREWVETIFDRFKTDMRWNAFRNHIGFLPELWYDIADEKGFLIQDEYHIWGGGRYWPKNYTVDAMAKEFERWMEERRNHPSVVIWDACNESSSFGRTRAAIQKVRGLDMSNRPWDNSHDGTPTRGDVLEEHPYHFNKKGFTLPMLTVTEPPKVHAGAEYRVMVINEYGYLWIQRAGTPTELTKDLYANLVGEDATPDQRRRVCAYYSAVDTEYFRRHLHGTPLLFFVSLTGSIPGMSATSDNWIDLENVKWEPHFKKYVRDAFAPVGVMIDNYLDTFPMGSTQEFLVFVMNDLGEPWSGDVEFRMLRGEETIFQDKKTLQVEGFGIGETKFGVTIPNEPGDYQLVPSIVGVDEDDETVRSLREFSLVWEAEIKEREGLAYQKTATASSVFGDNTPEMAVDGKQRTRWASNLRSDSEWFMVDLRETATISRIEID